jgi:hypothetical protein
MYIMTRTSSKVLVCAISVAVLAACPAVQPIAAQVLYGSIVGTIADQTGAALPNAHVTVTNPLTGVKREVEANATGQYTVPNLPEGTYNVAVSAPGFKEYNQIGIVVHAGVIARADATLHVGPTSQQVTVEAEAAMLKTENTDVSMELGTVAIQNLPTNFYRNFQALLLLAPGAVGDYGFTGAVADTPERAIAIPMNGMDPSSNSTRIDGAQSIFLWKPGGATLYVPPLESIQEVKITTNSFEPEKGMAGAAAVDVITKSGTNDLHGTLFWYHNNQHLNSCEPFNVACKWKAFDPGKPQNKPLTLINDIGANLGGPIKKNKLFYFFNWDGVFEHISYDDRYAVPTSDMRAGDFRAFLGKKISQCLARDAGGNCTQVGSPIMVPTSNGHGVIGPMVQLQQGMVFDPATGNPNGTGRAVYAAGGQVNVMPSDLFVPTAQTVLGLWPSPNVNPALWSIDSQGVAGRDYFLSTPQIFHRNNYDFKVDWNRTDKHFVWVKYSRMNAVTSVHCGYNPTLGGPCPAGSDGNTDVKVHTATLGHSWSLSRTFLVDGSLGFSRMDHLGLPSDFGKNIGLDVFKIPGTNDPNDPRYSGAPRLSIAGFNDLGSPYTWLPLYRNDWSTTFTQNASWQRANHSIRFGIDIVHNHMNHWQPENGLGPRGGVRFDNGKYTFLNLLDASGKAIQTDNPLFAYRDNQFANFLLGRYDSGGRTVQFQKANGKDTWYGFHFLDRWKLTPKLTLNMGIRYEYFPLMTRDSLGKGLEQYDPSTNTVLLGGLGGNPKSLGAETQKNMFEPRIGIAYQFRDKTVFRAGFGSTYDSFPILRQLRGPYPATISTDTSYNSTDPRFDTAAACAAGPSVLCDFQGLGTVSGGIAAVPLPNVSSGRIPLPTDVEIRFVGPGLLKRGRIETWNFSAERRLPGDMLLSVGYVGNRQTNGWGIKDLNASDIDQQAPLSAKWGRTANTFQLQGFLDSHYNALQVTLDRHYSKGLYLKGAYTYSKAINMSYDTDAWSGGYWNPPLFSGPSYLDRNRGMADTDRRHIFRMGYVWDVPLGSGHRFAGHNVIGRAALSGWQLNGIWSTTTGAPTTVFANPQFRSSGNHQTVDLVGPLVQTGCLGPGDNCHWYDPSAFAPVPLVTDPDGVQRQHRFGNTGRNIALYGPGHSNLDASLFRHFKLKERFDMQFRVEGLNVLNHPTWNWTTDEWGASNYCWGGGPTGNPCGGPGSTFMQAPDAKGHRTIRLGLRLAF